ncbi:FCD domain-containing protein [Nocardia sp. NPDC051787]|uniref:FCD domain-containing protein n=1 Tax=Nocardia sp. NPDC051787 TaxID=3155415 RepID=UPI00342B2AAB
MHRLRLRRGRRRCSVDSAAAARLLHRIALGYQHYSAQVVDEHRELATLLRTGDPETLARTAQEHVDSARRSLLADLPE